MVNFNSSITGLQAYETRQAVSSNDIANVNTAGYEESVVSQSDNGTSSGTSIDAINKISNSPSELSNTRLEVEMPEQMMNAKGYEANASVIKTQDQMLGSLMDIVS